MSFWNYQKVENRLRKLLGLPERPQDWMSPGWRSTPYEGDQELRQLIRLDEEETLRELEDEKAEGWRGSLASSLARLPWSMERKGSDFYWQARSVHSARTARRQLRDSRWIHFESPYVLETGFCYEVEGFLYASEEHQLPFMIVASGGLETSAKALWAEGDVLEGYRTRGGVKIIVPVKHLTQEDILRAIQHWYISQYGSDPLHWSNREGQLPNLYLHLSWQDWREYEPMWLPEESKDWDDEQYKKYRSSMNQKSMREARARRKELYRKFNLD